MSVEIGPADFAPFHDEIRGCECRTCRDVAYALCSVVDGPSSEQHLNAVAALLAELRAGTHRRMTLAERAAEARAEKSARLEQLRTAGAPQSEINAVERGYVRIDMAFLREGIGAGCGGKL